MVKIFKIAAISILLIVALILGMILNYYDVFPSGIIENKLSSFEKDTIPQDFLETPASYLETDVNSLISIHNDDDIVKLRNELINFIFGSPGIPQTLPESVEQNHNDDRYSDITTLKSIDKLIISMEFGIDSYPYIFYPKSPNGSMLIYHQGHRGDFYKSKSQIKAFLDNGYTVIAFSMPLLGMNNQPVVNLERFGNFKLTRHDHIQLLNPENGHPVKFFIEPIVIAINYLQKQYNCNSVAMAGISGGGWTTTLAAAVDTRIKNSFPVAGSYPLYLRSDSQRDWGDYEQFIPELYRTANYLELYILGASGKGRSQLQIINQFDACCFAGIKWETYKDIVVARVNDLKNGNYDLYLDDTHQQHMISEPVLNKIIEHLQINNKTTG